MARNDIVCAVILCLACGFAHSANRQRYTEDDFHPMDQKSLQEFDWQLFKKLTASDIGNSIISPISLKVILALLYEGSGGHTETELQNVVHFGNKSAVWQEYNEVIGTLTGQQPNCNGASMGVGRAGRQNPSQQYTLNLGTRIYLDQKFHAQQPFESKACEKYHTRIHQANFSNPRETSDEINKYVSKVTQGKIQKLVDSGDVEHSLMLFVNALYFRGYWVHRFPKEKTHQGGFYRTPHMAVPVEYMGTTEDFFYIESNELDAKIVRIPYKGKKFSMIVVLPNAKGGLPTLIDRLTVNKLRADVQHMQKQNVDLVIPKFAFQYQGKLSETLKKMHLTQIFESTASLPGIVRGSSFKLQVSEIIQKAGIEIDEEGSTAYAASDIQIGNKFGDAQIMFNATHPFLFYIQDEVTKTILFMGKVLDPSNAPEPLSTRYDAEESQPTDSQFYAHHLPIQPNRVGVPPLSTTPPSVGQVYPTTEFPVDESVTKRFNYFDLELLKAILERNPHENINLSPASIKTTLALILEGAQGKSALEIAQALRIPVEQQYVRNELKKLLYDISDKEGITTLHSANGIFYSNKLKIGMSYQKIAYEFYKSVLHPLNYNNPQESVSIVNNWVSQATRNMITSIVGPENFEKESGLVLANAVYFKSVWKYAFNPEQTTVRCFTLSTGQCVNVEMMHNSAEVRYKMVPEINAHALELPYADDYAMLILIPQVQRDTAALLRDLQHATFNAIVDQLERTEVIFDIPKFEIDANLPMKDILQKLQIREIFGDNANLSKIAQGMRVDNLVHKTKIEVNEQGTIASAVSTAVIIPLMGSSTPHIVANHPFAYFIYNTSTRNIIFEGVVNKPKEATVVQPANAGVKRTVPLRTNQQNQHLLQDRAIYY